MLVPLQHCVHAAILLSSYEAHRLTFLRAANHSEPQPPAALLCSLWWAAGLSVGGWAASPSLRSLLYTHASTHLSGTKCCDSDSVVGSCSVCFTRAGFSEYQSANVHVQCMIQHIPVLHDVSVWPLGMVSLSEHIPRLLKWLQTGWCEYNLASF